MADLETTNLAGFSDLVDLKAEEPWRIFRIMSEFIDSFETMVKYKRLVSVFGSARTKPEDPVYQDCVRLGELLTDDGYGILTGGGPGIISSSAEGKGWLYKLDNIDPTEVDELMSEEEYAEYLETL